MSFQQKNVAVSLGNFSLIMAYFLIRVFGLMRDGSFLPPEIFRLWGWTIGLSIIVTIAATILTHIVSAIIQAILSGGKEPEVEGMADERDKLIDLRGTKVTYLVSSIGVFLSMLSFVLNQQALVMFTLLIFFGLLAQIAGDVTRLSLYRRGV
jgi:hypothetical protein